MSDWEVSSATLSKLEALGLRLSLDDFGTGDRSLNYLNKLPVTKLKIYRSFISELSPQTDHHGHRSDYPRSRCQHENGGCCRRSGDRGAAPG